MRDPKDWDEDYLLSLPIGEFDWLEVKGRRGLDLTLAAVKEKDVRLNLSKAVSAMANSGGGFIVLGMKDPGGGVWEVDDGGVDLAIKGSSTREWLEDLLPPLVDGSLTSLNVYAFSKSANKFKLASGRGVFVVEIPDSEQAPHQAIDNRYYARVGGKSRPIGHKLVSDIFHRRRDPFIELEFAFEATRFIARGPFGIPQPGQQPEVGRRVELLVRARNVGRVYARYVNGIFYIPRILVPDYLLERIDLQVIDGEEYYSRQESNTRRDVVKADPMGGVQYGPSWFDPILPGLVHTWIWTAPEDFDKSNLAGEKIMWEVYADNAPSRRGEIKVEEIDLWEKDETDEE